MKASTKIKAFLYACLTIAIALFIINLVFKLITIAMWIGFLMLIPFLFKLIHMLIKNKKQ